MRFIYFVILFFSCFFIGEIVIKAEAYDSLFLVHKKSLKNIENINWKKPDTAIIKFELQELSRVGKEFSRYSFSLDSALDINTFSKKIYEEKINKVEKALNNANEYSFKIYIVLSGFGLLLILLSFFIIRLRNKNEKILQELSNSKSDNNKSEINTEHVQIDKNIIIESKIIFDDSELRNTFNKQKVYIEQLENELKTHLTKNNEN